ncbi:MAG: hypothetical protein PWP37_134 [Thermotogota bacterium]|nr:hypothetical protein [Thermotogota bacterium]MDK2863942.1 hypothetical protein [Thermotogota bacterium]HCZ05812.1 IclR family transcriptional regulator [Thermotogota bacterium]
MLETVKKVFEVLEWILKNPDGVTASDLSRCFNMSLSNAYKYLSTLEFLGVLVRKSDKRYTGGFKLLEYGSAVLRNLDIRQIARPYLAKLLTKTNQTVHLVIKDGFEGVYVEKLESAHSLPMVSRIGMRSPLYCTAFGKAILSRLPEKELEEYLRSVKLEKRTEHTITDPERLREELKKVRERGYAVDMEENELGVVCVGAPILDHDGYPVAGISISGVARKLLPKIREYGELVKNCAREISRMMGYKEE